MRTTDEFNIYTTPTDDSLNELWSKSIFVFDTSALLYFYYFSKSSRSKIFEETLNPIKDKLWIPQHVLYEYRKNREETIKKPIIEKYKPSLSNIQSISNSIKDIEGKLHNFKETTKKTDSHPYIESNINEEFLNKFLDFKSEFEKYEKNINIEFENRKNEISSLLENDDVFNYIITNFKIGNAYSFNDIINIIYKEGEIRYRNQIPPGYEDEKRKLGTQKYGDLIIWKQILSYAKLEEISVIYVTNDVKPDWCHNYKHDGEIRISKPREELLKEFYDHTNSRFWMYTFNQFLYNYQKVFSAVINQEVLDEATLATINNETHASNKFKYKLEFNTGSTHEAIDLVNNNLDKIGKILCIKHSRNMDNVYYLTEIIGYTGILKIHGGLTSGYCGTGPNGFIRLLISLGIDKDVADEYVTSNGDNIHSFEISFITKSDFSSDNTNYSVCPVCGSSDWNGSKCMSCGRMCDD